MNDEETFDVGNNLETLGWAFLIFCYMLPLVFALAAVTVGALFLRWFITIAVQNPIGFIQPVR